MPLKRSNNKRRNPQSLPEDEPDSRLVPPKRWRYKTSSPEYETDDKGPLFTPRTASPHSSELSKPKRVPETQDDEPVRPAPAHRFPSHQAQTTRRKDFIYVPGAYYTRDIAAFIGAMPRPVSALDFTMDAYLAKLSRELPMPMPKPRVPTPKLTPDASRVSSSEEEEARAQLAGKFEVLRRCEERIFAMLSYEQKQALDRHSARSKAWNDPAALRRDQVASYDGLQDSRMEHHGNYSTTSQDVPAPASYHRRVLARAETFIELPSTARAAPAHNQATEQCSPSNQIGRGAGRRTAKLAV
jgi:hypothetical protein